MEKNVKHAIVLISLLSIFMFGTILYALNAKKEYIAIHKESLKAFNVSTYKIIGRRDSIVAFAKSFLGTPYEYSKSSPDGFDCSGFIYYVYSKFNIKISRSSYTIAEEGVEVDSSDAQKGDLIFFRSTDRNDPKIGHVGIIISEKGKPIEFIHSSSSIKNNGVIITKLNSSHYRERYVKIKNVL